MVDRVLGQLSLADGLARSEETELDRIARVIDWAPIKALLGQRSGPGRGELSYPAEPLLRCLLLGVWNGLSDPALEAQVRDRLSFRRFAGLGLEETIPDHTVINRFRNLLIEKGLLEKLFGELDRQLDKAGLILRRGTMLDATLIAATSTRPTDERPSRDADARLARRQGKAGSVFGYKAHVGVDEGSDLIRKAIATPANVNDTVPADDLMLGDEKAVWGDAAYHTHAREAALKARGVKARLARRANKHHPELPPRLKRYNRLIGRRRAAVETTFATLKNRMRLTRIRYVGLIRAQAQLTLAAIAFNLRRWAAITP